MRSNLRRSSHDKAQRGLLVAVPRMPSLAKDRARLEDETVRRFRKRFRIAEGKHFLSAAGGSFGAFIAGWAEILGVYLRQRPSP
jgi:hypothetical protein